MISHQMMVFPAQYAYEDNGEWDVRWSDGYEIYPFDMEETEENILTVLRQHEDRLGDVKVDDLFADEGAYWIRNADTGEPLFSIQMLL